MRPRSGISIEQTLRQLRELATQGRNLQSGGLNVTDRQNRFLMWVHDVAQTFEYTFTGVNLSRLHTERYWRIVDMTSGSPRPMEFISDEAEVQVRRLEAIIEALLEDTPNAPDVDVVAVPDTNALLHYRLFDEVDWPNVLDVRAVRLAVPLRVIDELDAKKASRRKDLADRAAVVLSHLEQRVGATMGQAAEVRERVTVEIARPLELDAEPYEHPADADTEVLDTCESLSFFCAAPVQIVTGDYGMRLRASARGIRAVGMPETLRHRADATAAT